MAKRKPVKPSLRSTVIYLPPYNSMLIVVQGKVLHGWLLYDHLKSEHGVHIEEVLEVDVEWAGCVIRVGGASLLWIPATKVPGGRSGLVNIIAHESLHVTRGVMLHAGIPKLRNSNEEAWTYLVGYIASEVYQFMVSE